MKKTEKQFGILFSHASRAVYDELVTTDRFETAVEAAGHGERIARIQGVEYEVMLHVEGRWLSKGGETAAEVIRRRWAL